MMHIAESRAQARAEVEIGLPRALEYDAKTSERTLESRPVEDNEQPPSVDEIIEGLGGTQIACVGTPADAIALIRNLQEVTGGFGKVLLFSGNDWAAQDATVRSLELIAREVMPAFQGSADAQVRSMERVRATRLERVQEQRVAIDQARSDYVR
jgi:limonene 1,2-monooxygenase